MYPSQFRYYWAWKRNLIIFDSICYVKQPQSESLDTYLKKKPTNMYRIFLILIDVFTSMVIEVLLTLLHFAVDITRVMNLLYRFSCLWLTSQWFLQITDGVATFSSSIDFYPICSIFHIYCLWICFIQLNVLYILYVHVLQISIYKHFLILCDVKNLYDGIVATWRIFEYKLISIILYVVG